MKTIIGFINSYCEGISGGDVRFIELFKRFTDLDRIVVTSSNGRDTCEANGLNCSYFITTKEDQISNVPYTYLMRIYRSLKLDTILNDGDILYSSSDFLPDTIFPAVAKLKKKNLKWVMCIFLVVPSIFKDYNKRFIKDNHFSMPSISRFLYFLSQRMTISLGKRFADKILVLNELDKRYLISEKGVEDSKIYVVNGGIDYYYLKNLTPQSVKYDGVFLARFHPQKGIFDLIDIWRVVCSKLPNAKLCLIGGGIDERIKEVKSYIEYNGLEDNVDMVGPKFGVEKYKLLKSAKLFLYPSYYESFAIVIAEAMGCNLPIIAYDLPIYANIYKDNIFNIPLGEIDKFADCIINLLNNDELRTYYSIRVQNFIKRYDWSIIAENELTFV